MTEKQSKWPMKFSDGPTEWVDRSDNGHSDKAIYTCENCETRHKGFDPDECVECSHNELDWSYAYSYGSTFPFA